MGVSVGRLLTAVMAVAAPNLLGYQSVHPLRSHTPRPIDTGNGERDEEGLFTCLMRVPGLPVPSIMWDRGTEAIAFLIWMFLIACPPSYDCRAILRRPVRVVIWSGLD